jgi:hypothetical protein
MANGYSLHIGLNAVDPHAYDGWEGKLKAAENDARDMKRIAESQGHAAKLLLAKDASSTNILYELTTIAHQAQPDDLIIVSYSGHGGQVRDVSGDEEDDFDETWCAYDRMIIDDELYHCWGKFRPGVRIFVLSDSCHSGSVSKNLRDEGVDVDELTRINASLIQLHANMFEKRNGSADYRPKAAPFDITINAYSQNKAMYDAIQYAVSHEELKKIQASVILISACQDNQTSWDGASNGVFTSILKKVWNSGAFDGDYIKFHKTITQLSPSTQTPNYLLVGEVAPEFERSKPFSIKLAEARSGKRKASPARAAGLGREGVAQHRRA